MLCCFVTHWCIHLLQGRRTEEAKRPPWALALTCPHTLKIGQAPLGGVLVAHMPGRLADKGFDDVALPQRSASSSANCATSVYTVALWLTVYSSPCKLLTARHGSFTEAWQLMTAAVPS